MSTLNRFGLALMILGIWMIVWTPNVKEHTAFLWMCSGVLEIIGIVYVLLEKAGG